MFKAIKKIIKVFIPKSILENYNYKIATKRIIENWIKTGKPIPAPDSVKQKIVSDYQKKYKTDVFIETGTYLGYMDYAQRNNFKEIHTIELMEKYYLSAVEKFKKYKHIHCYQGDSTFILPLIMEKISKKVLFWLDAHYSIDLFAKGEKDCPIFEELDAIFNKDLGHIILIDDARDFTGIGDYPTVEKVKEYVLTKNSTYNIFVEHDIIFCIPQ
jgi:hypothetical protein